MRLIAIFALSSHTGDMTATQSAKLLLLDSKGELLRARSFSATSIHTPKPEDPARPLCGGRVMLCSEFECESRWCEHEGPQLHQADLTICAGADPQLCKRCERSVARPQREAQATQPAPGPEAPGAEAPGAAKAARSRIIEAAEVNGWTADKGYSSEGAWAGHKGSRHVSLEFSVRGGITWACTDKGLITGRGRLARVLEYVSARPDPTFRQGMPMRDIFAEPKAAHGPVAVED
jgi:hypothetical protein